MFKIFSNAFKVKEIRKKILFVLMVIAIYRLGNAIPLPGINVSDWLLIQGRASDQITLRSLIGGGIGTIFYMGVGPFITSSIVMQLLTFAIPALEQLQKEGKDGQDKIKQITRWVAVALAILNAIAAVYSLVNFDIFGIGQGYNLFKYANPAVYALAVLTMVAGTVFIMWLSELLTEHGFGNGTSFIIFANIIGGFPAQIMNIYSNLQYMETNMAVKILIGVAVFVLFLIIVFLAVWVQDGERKIPVQYSKKVVGRQLVGGQSSNIPLKVNIAGVMSIIFALSLSQIPELIYSFTHAPWLEEVVRVLKQSHPIGAIVYIILIFFFTFFYTSFAMNPTEMAENLKKSGGFIPGIRPGKPTSDFIVATINKLSWIGASFYALIAFSPIVFQWITKIEVGFGGTTLLIISSTALETVKQLEALLIMRHYKGFLK